MRMFFKIVKYRFLSSLKHPVVLVCLLAALLSSIVVGVYASRTQNDNAMYPIAIVDEDGGEHADYFIEEISNNKQVQVSLLTRDKAIRQVSVGRIDGAFILLDGFSDKIAENDYEDLVEFVSPAVTTSAYPVSEIVASEIMDMWLYQLVENTIFSLHEKLGDEAKAEYDDIIAKIDTDYVTDDIISIDFIGDTSTLRNIGDTLPIDRAIGVYASFVFFAIMLSGEWIFNIKKKSLQSRFISHSTSVPLVCLGSQFASALVSMVFFVPLIVFMYFYLSLTATSIFYLTLGMMLFSLCICSMAFVVSTFAENLAQLVVVGTSVSIMNILLSSLAMPLPQWASAAQGAATILPGTYLIGSHGSLSNIFALVAVTAVWMAIGYLSALRLKKKAVA